MVIGDRVWLDTDGDGVQETGEPGVAGVSVQLYDGQNQLVATTVTDQDGKYQFTDLEAGAYTLYFIPLTGYGFCPQNKGDDSTDSDANPATGMTSPFTLVPGTVDLDWDAGLVPEPSGPLVTIEKTLSLSVARASVGTELAFTIKIRNLGSVPLTTVPVDDIYDKAGLQYLRTTIREPVQDEVDGKGRLAWDDVTTDLGDVPPGGSIEFQVTFRVIGAGTITNLAQLGSVVDGNGAIVSPFLTNGGSSVEFEAVGPTPLYLPIVQNGVSTQNSNAGTGLPCNLQGCDLNLLHPKGMAFHRGQNALYVVSRDTNALLKIDPNTAKIIATIPAGAEPWDVVVNERTNRLYVSNFASGDVWVYDAASLSKIAEIPVGAEAAIMEVLPDIDTVAVVVRSKNGVAIIKGLSLYGLVGTKGHGAYGLAADPVNNQLIVTNRDSQTARVLYEAGGQWKNDGAEIKFGEKTVPFEAAYNPDNQKLYIVHSTPDGTWKVDVYRKNSATHVQLLTRVSVGRGGSVKDPDVGGTGLVVNRTTGNVFNANTAVDTLTVIRGSDDRVIATLPTGDDPFTLAVDPGSNTVFVALRRVNRLGMVKDDFQ